MPKQEYPLLDFSGGLSNNSNGRDIADNELQQADGIVVDDIGKIKTIGGFTSSITSTNLATIDDIEAGYGLFVFGTDYELTSGGGLVFVAIAGYAVTSDNFICRILELGGDYSIYATELELNTTDNTGFKPVFYYIDGILRICDGSLDDDSTNKWFGYLRKSTFPISGNPIYDYDAYNNGNTTIAPPSAGIIAEDLDFIGQASSSSTQANLDIDISDYETELDGGDYIAINATEHSAETISSATSGTPDYLTTSACTDWTGDTGYIFPPNANGINLVTSITGSAGSWQACTLEFASTYIYDKYQESPLYNMTGEIDISDNDSINVLAYLSPGPDGYNVRISGIRVYTRRKDTDDSWYLFCDIDFENGGRVALDANFEEFNQIDATAGAGYIYVQCGAHDSYSQVDSFDSVTGMPIETETVDIKYKTAVVANRMAYVGNVKYNGTKYEDAIFKSYVNRFDTFTLDRRLEILRGDGESIIKLEEFADRILVFKEQTMYILNVSQEVEFLEAKYEFRGVKYPYQTVRTEYGIAWANEFGVYLYDGQQVHDLLLDRQNPARRKISMSYWQSFWDSTGSIAFDPNSKRLLLLPDITSTSNENIMLYSLTTGSWTRGVNKLPLASHKYSNIVNSISNGDMIVYDATDSYIYKWSDTATGSPNIIIVTKDIYFGALIPDKRFYGVNIRHKYAGDDMVVSCSSDGGNTYTTIGTLTDSLEYITEELRLTTPISCKSIVIRIRNTSSTALEIDDISLLYRMKGVR